MDKDLLVKIENHKLEMFDKDEKGKVTGVKFSKEEKDKAEDTIDMCIQNLANKLEYFGICLTAELQTRIQFISLYIVFSFSVFI